MFSNAGFEASTIHEEVYRLLVQICSKRYEEPFEQMHTRFINLHAQLVALEATRARRALAKSNELSSLPTLESHKSEQTTVNPDELEKQFIDTVGLLLIKHCLRFSKSIAARVEILNIWKTKLPDQASGIMIAEFIKVCTADQEFLLEIRLNSYEGLFKEKYALIEQARQNLNAAVAIFRVKKLDEKPKKLTGSVYSYHVELNRFIYFAQNSLTLFLPTIYASYLRMRETKHPDAQSKVNNN